MKILSASLLVCTLVSSFFLIKWYQHKDLSENTSATVNQIKKDPKKFDSVIVPEVIEERYSLDTKVVLNTGNRTLFDRLADIAKNSNLKSALDYAMSLQGRERSGAVKFVFMVAIREDPEFVLTELENSGLETVYKNQLIPHLMNRLENVDEALSWTYNHLSGSQRSESIAILIGRMAKNSPDKAIASVGRMLPGKERDGAFSAMIRSWGSADFKSAITYSLQLGNSDDRSLSIRALSPIWVKSDLESAINLIDQESTNPDFVLLAHLTAVERAKSDPVRALKWVQTLSGVAGERAIRSTIIQFVQDDPAGIAVQIEAMSEPQKNKMVPIWTAAWSKFDPEAVGESLLSCRSINQKVNMIDPLVHRWYSIDPDRACEWVSGLPDGDVRTIGMKLLDGIESSKSRSELYRKYIKWYGPVGADDRLFSR